MADRRISLANIWAGIDSLAARTIVVVLLGIGTVHLASLWTYQRGLSHELELSSEARLADRLLSIKRAVLRAAPAERETVAHDMSGGPLEAHWSRTERAVAGGPGAERWQSLGERLRSVAPEIAADGLIIGANRNSSNDPHLALISIRLPDTSWVNVSLLAWDPQVGTSHGTLLSTSLMALGGIVLSVLLVRWLTRPFSTFATASKDAYRSKAPVRVPETGPREVRELAVAFNDMQRRIGRLIEDRTQALAAVSHDLKTPITRLRFRAEDVEDQDTREAIARDLDDMQRMIDQTLAFLRGDRADEEMRPVDLVTILETIADEATDLGWKASLAAPASLVVMGRRLALKRAIGNLVENAEKYGGSAAIRLARSGDHAVITVDDEGPGIPQADRARALQPFVRLEPSRNGETGGFGLGLTIAAAIVEGHNGHLEFEQRHPKGFRVIMRLPVETATA